MAVAKEVRGKRFTKVIEWIKLRRNTSVVQYRNLVIVSVASDNLEVSGDGPAVSIYTENDLSNWWKKAADHMAAEATEIGAALEATWPTSRTVEDKEEEEAA